MSRGPKNWGGVENFCKISWKTFKISKHFWKISRGVLKGLPPFPNKKFFFVFFDFHFQRCIRLYSIRAVKIRSLPNRIVREKANFRRGVPPKKQIFFSRYICAHSMRDTIKPKIIHNKKSWKKQILSFSQNRFLSNRERFSPFFSKTAGPIRLKIFL